VAGIATSTVTTKKIGGQTLERVVSVELAVTTMQMAQ
jgi:hypothetical protein